MCKDGQVSVATRYDDDEGSKYYMQFLAKRGIQFNDFIQNNAQFKPAWARVVHLDPKHIGTLDLSVAQKMVRFLY